MAVPRSLRAFAITMMEKFMVMTPTALTDQIHMTGSFRKRLFVQTVAVSTSEEFEFDGQVADRLGTPRFMNTAT
jgi:hypothetical protein